MLKTHIKNLPQMETIAHQYLTKLRIIAKIPENGQLDLTNNDLNIYTPGFVNWINRKLQGDGKLNTVTYLRTFYREINNFTTELMKSIEVEQNSVSKSRKTILLASLAEKVKVSTVGVENLMKTYRSWHKIISTLESVQQDIIENQLKNIILFLPKEYKTDVLKEIENGQYDMLSNSPSPTQNIPERKDSLSVGSIPSESIPIPGSQSPISHLGAYNTPHSFPQPDLLNSSRSQSPKNALSKTPETHSKKKKKDR